MPSAFIHARGYLRLADSASSPQELEKLLARMLRTGLVASLVAEARRDPRIRRVIASESYRHANGFEKIVLATRGRLGAKLRAHVWHQADDPDRFAVHDHAWDFASFVASGGLEAHFYAPADSGARFSRFELGTLADPHVQEGEDARLAIVATQRFLAPTMYGQEAVHLHDTWALMPNTVTVLLQGSHRHSHTSIFVKGRFPPQPYNVAYFDELQILPSLKCIESALTACAGKSRSNQ
jgi:hypothetical protein